MGLSFGHIVIVLLVVLVLFGAGRLPSVMGDLAKGIKNFKAGMNDDEGDDRRPNEAPHPRAVTHHEPLAPDALPRKDEVRGG